mgnify:CR=1 FL=1
MKQIAFLRRDRPAVPSVPPGEGDFGGIKSLDSCLRRNDTVALSIRLNVTKLEKGEAPPESQFRDSLSMHPT